MNFEFKRDILNNDEELYERYHIFEVLCTSIYEKYPDAIVWIVGDIVLATMKLIIKFFINNNKYITAEFDIIYGTRTNNKIYYSYPTFDYYIGSKNLKNTEFINRFFKEEKLWIDRLDNISTNLTDSKYILEDLFSIMNYIVYLDKVVSAARKDANISLIYINKLKTDITLYQLLDDGIKL